MLIHDCIIKASACSDGKGISMNTKNKTNDAFDRVEITVGATVIYADNTSEFFEALRVIDNDVIIGRILKTEYTKPDNSASSYQQNRDISIDEFIECGFIAKGMIKQINPGSKRKIFQKKTHLLL